MSKGIYIGTKTANETYSTAKAVSKLYTGVLSDVPIYNITYETVYYNITNFEQFFYKEESGTFIYAEYSPYVQIKNSSSGSKTVTLTVLHDLSNVDIKYYYQYTFYPLTISINGVSQTITTSSSVQNISIGNLSQGDTLTFTMGYTSGTSCPYVRITCDTIEVEKSEITGYEEKEVSRKIIKGYVGKNNIARLFYGGNLFGGYTGHYATSEIVKDGTTYTLYTMTTSGTLTLNGDAEYWMCGSGAGGANGSCNISLATGGNGGGGGYVRSGTLTSDSHVVTIAAGGASDTDGTITSIGTITASGGYTNGNGGSGGGAKTYAGYNSDEADHLTWVGTAGTGAGISTYPFGLSSLKAHSAGGGSGLAMYRKRPSSDLLRIYGCAGGTKGGAGGATAGSSGAGTGGEYGGGAGAVNSEGSSGSFYGAAGGGGYASRNSGSGEGSTSKGGTGYQGVLYLLIPN